MGTRRSSNTVDSAVGTVNKGAASKTVTLFSVYSAVPTDALCVTSTHVTEVDGNGMVMFESQDSLWWYLGVESVMVWVQNAPDWFICLNPSPTACGAVWEARKVLDGGIG